MFLYMFNTMRLKANLAIVKTRNICLFIKTKARTNTVRLRNGDNRPEEGDMAIQFKACPRCGGDIDATYRDDIYCVQCAYRPLVAGSISRRVRETTGSMAAIRPPGVYRTGGGTRDLDSVKGENAGPMCPKCSRGGAVRLDRIRPRDNTCYRCRLCGHVFSPTVPFEQASHGSALS
jgi:ribosomal protein S27AE